LSCGSGDGNKADDGTGETDGGHENKAIAFIIASLPGLKLFWDIIVLRGQEGQEHDEFTHVMSLMESTTRIPENESFVAVSGGTHG
jgi:hypothetical protein